MDVLLLPPSKLSRFGEKLNPPAYEKKFGFSARCFDKFFKQIIE